MNNEVRERLRNLSRRLADAAFARACDGEVRAEEFQEALDALDAHLKEVRRRYAEMHLERELV
ncbi:MAG TPA: hypothetical protein VL221_11715 [Bacteroidota bacterium]|nr:hypothetical protein [Bacteroidota bacterium]